MTKVTIRLSEEGLKWMQTHIQTYDYRRRCFGSEKWVATDIIVSSDVWVTETYHRVTESGRKRLKASALLFICQLSETMWQQKDLFANYMASTFTKLFLLVRNRYNGFPIDKHTTDTNQLCVSKTYNSKSIDIDICLFSQWIQMRPKFNSTLFITLGTN